MWKMLILAIAKSVYLLSRILKIGSGFTWPGHIVLFFYPDFIQHQSLKLKKGIVLISGTNGKTTTTQAVVSTLRQQRFRVVTNISGANLLNGIASAFVNALDFKGDLPADLGVFEVDEAAFPKVLTKMLPRFVVLLDLFRDQLDRYGEVDTVVSRWETALKDLPDSAEVLINANDPALSYLGERLPLRVKFFGLDDLRFDLKAVPHHADSSFCLSCDRDLTYDACFFSHIGIWRCLGCGRSMPKADFEAGNLSIGEESMTFSVDGVVIRTGLTGLYNAYNLTAAYGVAFLLGLTPLQITAALRNFSPHFGRQETLKIRGRRIRILLSKNPTGFNENLRLLEMIHREEDSFLFILNDNIADGRDVSWIYDVNFETFPNLLAREFYISGTRAFDLALRLKYANLSKGFVVSKDLSSAFEELLSKIGEGGTLNVLATYTGMLAARKILTGRGIG